MDLLHGPAEAHEDILQLCIMKSNPEKYWNYLKKFQQQVLSGMAECHPP
jgi:hypothetical protein